MPRSEVRGIKGQYMRDAMGSTEDFADGMMRDALALEARAEQFRTVIEGQRKKGKAASDPGLIALAHLAHEHEEEARRIRGTALAMRTVVNGVRAYEADPAPATIPTSSPKENKKEQPVAKQRRIPGTVAKEDEVLLEAAEAFVDAKLKEKRAKGNSVAAESTLRERMKQKHRRQMIVGAYTITIEEHNKVKVSERKEEQPDEKSNPEGVAKEKETAGAK